MKANELMIGDWVIVRRPSNRLEKVRVKSVIGNGTIEAKTKDGLVVFGELAVEPIPLTGEILEKNGLEQRTSPEGEKKYGLTSYEEDYTLEFSFIKNKRTWCDIHGSFKSYHGYINYVHELQHALRLCGVEKEIIL